MLLYKSNSDIEKGSSAVPFTVGGSEEEFLGGPFVLIEQPMEVHQTPFVHPIARPQGDLE
jgi:hypothetical protein